MTEVEIAELTKLYMAETPVALIFAMFPYTQYEIRDELRKIRNENPVKEADEAVKEVYESGITAPYLIADKTGFNIDTVRHSMSRQKLRHHRPEHNYLPTTLSETTNQIIAAIKGGDKVADICQQFGFSRQYIYEVKRKYVDIC